MTQAASQTNAPFSASAPSPTVQAVKGSANRMTVGQMSAFSRPRTAAARSAAGQLASETPGTKAAPT